jgi:hypothetical protein
MSIIKYLAESERTYHYRIKTVFELDDAAMDQIERVLAKYVPVDIKAVKKTIIQKNPLDFPNVDAAEVYILDIALQLPASGYVLAQEIKLALAIPDKFVVVRSSNDPTSLETDRLNAEKDIHDQAEKKGLLHASLLLAPKYEEVHRNPRRRPLRRRPQLALPRSAASSREGSRRQAEDRSPARPVQVPRHAHRRRTCGGPAKDREGL